MYYEIHGAGPPVLLLHGGFGNGMQFSHQVADFARRHRIIVPDLCAQGRTSDRPGPLTFHDMAEDVVGLLDSLRLERADIMGWSDGGVVGLDLAIHHRARVRRLVTFGANFAPDGLNPADVAWADTATARSFGPDARRDYAALAPASNDFDTAIGKIIAMWRREPHFSLRELGMIRARTMIAAGDHDVVRREHSVQLANAIPGARLWIVPHASHSVMMEQPELVNRTVLEFLEHP
jgi:pimeloyl-ACP methyl ester carboxylesterase